jgi:hypothetical protein
MSAVGAENRSYEMQIAQKCPEGDGVGPNSRRLAYGKSATALAVQQKEIKTMIILPQKVSIGIRRYLTSFEVDGRICREQES